MLKLSGYLKLHCFYSPSYLCQVAFLFFFFITCRFLLQRPLFYFDGKKINTCYFLHQSNNIHVCNDAILFLFLLYPFHSIFLLEHKSSYFVSDWLLYNWSVPFGYNCLFFLKFLTACYFPWYFVPFSYLISPNVSIILIMLWSIFLSKPDLLTYYGSKGLDPLNLSSLTCFSSIVLLYLLRYILSIFIQKVPRK